MQAWMYTHTCTSTYVQHTYIHTLHTKHIEIHKGIYKYTVVQEIFDSKNVSWVLLPRKISYTKIYNNDYFITTIVLKNHIQYIRICT